MNKTESLPRLSAESSAVMPQASFAKALELEQRRTERSRRRFILMLLESRTLLKNDAPDSPLERILGALAASTRDTDTKGWHQEGTSLGIIFVEVAPDDARVVADALRGKMQRAMAGALNPTEIQHLSISAYVFPEDWDEGESLVPLPRALREQNHGERTASRIAKRCLDILGSGAAILVLSPIMAAVAVAVKLTSEGPVLFRQSRQGQYGRHFTFLKFRSMYAKNDPKIHQEYVSRLIAGQAGKQGSANGQEGVYKLTKDPRITPVGTFLRRTSLDELPQFFNVLMGEMSLVGPRPPIPYEVKQYDIWHKRRLLEAKPGITGLWQVHGRSRTTFDEMVRLDLQYARTWSVWLDVKILIQTPRAVLMGDGAV